MQNIIQFISNHFILITLWIVLLCLLIFNILKMKFSKIILISCNEAIRLINKEEAIIIDLRNCNDYNKGCIVNSLNFKIEDIKSGNLLDINRFKNKSIILVCSNGHIARNSAKYLMKMNFKKVYVLQGGISNWIRENLPLVSIKK